MSTIEALKVQFHTSFLDWQMLSFFHKAFQLSAQLGCSLSNVPKKIQVFTGTFIDFLNILKRYRDEEVGKKSLYPKFHSSSSSGFQVMTCLEM